MSRTGAGRGRSALHTLIAQSSRPRHARPHHLPSTARPAVPEISEELCEAALEDCCRPLKTLRGPAAKKVKHFV